MIKNKNKTKADQTTTTSTVFSIDNLGMEEEFPTNSQYGNTTGDVKKENIVEKDGKYYADKESADKSDKVGQTKVDTQNGKLEVKPDGTVVEKETGSQGKQGQCGSCLSCHCSGQPRVTAEYGQEFLSETAYQASICQGVPKSPEKRGSGRCGNQEGQGSHQLRRSGGCKCR